MRLVVQRVKSASVTIGGKTKASINQGLLVLVGIEDIDTDEDIEWLCGKLLRLRVFDDADGCRSVGDGFFNFKHDMS